MSKQHLTDGLDAQQREELDDLRDLQTRLMDYDAPEPNSAALLKRLKPMLPETAIAAPMGLQYWLWLARSQLSLLDRTFWWASILLVAVGVFLCASSAGSAAVIFALLSPVLAVAGVAYIFRPTARSLREMELLSAVRPLEMLYARLVLLFAYNGVLLLALLLFAWSQGLQIVLGRLLLIWFGPMIGLTGLALYITIRWNALAGMIAPLLMWCTLTVLGWHEVMPEMNAFPLWNTLLQIAEHSNLLMIWALVALVGGAVLLLKTGRMIEQEWAS